MNSDENVLSAFSRISPSRAIWMFESSVTRSPQFSFPNRIEKGLGDRANCQMAERQLMRAHLSSSGRVKWRGARNIVGMPRMLWLDSMEKADGGFAVPRHELSLVGS
jgi:hypothetical protein